MNEAYDASDSNQTFWGIWAVRTKGLPAPLRQLDVYYLGLDRQSAQFDQSTNVERRHTLGLNLKEQAGDWSFGQEGDLQLGTFGSDGLVAWKVAQGRVSIPSDFLIVSALIGTSRDLRRSGH